MAHTPDSAFDAAQVILAIGGVGLLALVVNGEAVFQRDGGVVELRVIRQLLNTGGADFIDARKRALVHGRKQLDLGLRVGHPLADAPRRLLGGTLEILGVLLGNALVVHRREQRRRRR